MTVDLLSYFARVRTTETSKFAAGIEPVIAVVKRGVCTFVEKAKNVQLAFLGQDGAATEGTKPLRGEPPPTPPGDGIAISTNGGIAITTAAAAAAAATESAGSQDAETAVGGGMVLLNGEDALADMPAGNLVTDDVTIPVAM